MSDQSSEPVIEVSNLTKTYGPVVAIDELSFTVRPDEVFALVGPNGAGKTVTVEILECLRSPTSGTATVLGFDVEESPRAIKEQIGVLPQSFHTFERLTVRENIRLVAELYDEGLAVETVIDQLDLEEYAGTRFDALSGGWQRRTGLAMALVSDPELLFLDEPTTGLDPSARRTTWTQIQRLAEHGTAVVLTTHYMDEVEQLADRAALLVDGSLEAVDAVPTLIEEYGGDVKLIVRMAGSGTEPADETATDIERLLRQDATEVYRNETGDLVGIFADRTQAQDTFGRLHDRDRTRSIDLVSAGMEDVFLQLAGGTPDPGGEFRTVESTGGESE
jgi:ABC-2 type transport system ATP-binding protein